MYASIFTDVHESVFMPGRSLCSMSAMCGLRSDSMVGEILPRTPSYWASTYLRAQDATGVPPGREQGAIGS